MTHPGRIVRTTAVLVGLAYAGALYAVGIRLSAGTKQMLAYLPTVLALVVVAFDKWIWRWPVVCKLHSRARIDGLWKVELRPDAASYIPVGGNRGPIDGYMVVEQTFWLIALTQFTAESSSYSKTATFLKRADSSKRVLVFVYDNEPRREHLHRSQRNTGGCQLEVANGSPRTMTGAYFTDRFTAGAMQLKLVDRTTNYVDFEQSAAHVSTVAVQQWS